jgi:hypothetical protein
MGQPIEQAELKDIIERIYFFFIHSGSQQRAFRILVISYRQKTSGK